MKNSNYKNIVLIVFVNLLFTIGNSNAQELSVGTDFVSRYIWRGIELGGNTPSFQPTVKLTVSSLTAGFWGAYSLSDSKGLNEIDIYASYSFELSDAGSLSFGVTDYTNPNSGTKIGNIHNHNDEEGPGAHFIELNAGYAGSESFPLSLSFNMFLYNLKNNPIYLQVGYSTSIENVVLDLFAGGTPGEDTEYYGTTNFSIINFGFTASKSIKFTEDFSLPIFGSVILNPASENLFFVAGFRL
jgi:hypothetical protein